MPSIPPNLDWLFLTIGGLLALGSLFLLFWSLFRDRARARFRCPKCWYDLTQPEGAAPILPITCSECGRVTTKIKRLKNIRPRWRYALVALLLIPGAGVVACYPQAHRNGWAWFVPTRVIMDTMPVFGYPSALTQSLTRRLQNSTIAKNPSASGIVADAEFARIAYIAQRCAAGTPNARPFSEAWMRSFGEFLRKEKHWLALNQGGPGSMRKELGDALHPLLELQPLVTIHTRDAWPEEFPIWVETSFCTWCPSGWIGLEYGSGTALHGATPNPQPRESAGNLELRMTLRWGLDHAGHPRDQEVIRVSTPYRIAGSFADYMTPVTDPGLDQYVQSIVSQRQGRIQVDMWNSQAPFAMNIAFGVIVEYSLDGSVVATERRWWGFANPPKPGAYPSGSEFLSTSYESRGRIHTVRAAGEHWTVRIRSDPETALRVFDADKYWQGDVTIPLTIR